MKNVIFTMMLGGAFALLSTPEAHAQCRSFTKRNCMTQLEGYIQNDNYNSAILIPGDEAELMLTFLAGQDYRLVVCSHPILGDIEYEIRDAAGSTLYNSEKASEDRDYVDFKVQTTQQLLVQISVPASEAAILHEGCVTVLVGSKAD